MHNLLKVEENNKIYRKMANVEGEFWGNEWDETKTAAYQKPLSKYENELFADLDSEKFWGWVDKIIGEIGYRENILSLGAGVGAAERKIAELKNFKNLHLVDISHDACIKAKNYFGKFTNDEQKIDIQVRDINFIELEENKYDLILCFGVVHHITNLENLFYNINRSLKKDGILLLSENVGENHYQFSEKRLGIINKFMKDNEDWMPYKYEAKNEKWGGGFCSPFECVRSADICNLIENVFKFEVVREVKFAGFYFPFLILSKGMWRKLNNEAKEKLFEKICEYDKYLSVNNLIEPYRLFGLYKKNSDFEESNLRCEKWNSREVKENIDERSQLDFLARIKYNIKKTSLYKKLRRNTKVKG
jgi:SAM-dependent methyltransferase